MNGNSNLFLPPNTKVEGKKIKFNAETAGAADGRQFPAINRNGPVVLDTRAPIVELGLLGQMVTFDRTKLSKTTVMNSVSHVNVLKRNNIPITEADLTHNTVALLDRLVDGRGNLLSTDYKRQIGMTIKRLYPNANINLSTYNSTRRRRNRMEAFTNQANHSGVDYVHAVRLVRDECVNILLMSHTRQSIDDLGMYDAAIAVLLTISTSLRIKELLQLRMNHIPDILESKQITIHSKSNKNVRSVAPNDLLVNVFQTIQVLRPLVRANIQAKNNRNIRPQIERFNDGYLLISSDDFMTKKLKDIAAMAGAATTLTTFGFNTFRRYITSTLIEGGGHYIAQSMNNHSNLNTTLDHYNVVGPESMQTVYRNLFDTMNQIDNSKGEQKLLPKSEKSEFGAGAL